MLKSEKAADGKTTRKMLMARLVGTNAASIELEVLQ
jgi:hypothetical protein